LLVVFHLSPIEQLLDDSCLRVEDGVVLPAFSLIDEGSFQGGGFLSFEESFAEGESLAQSFNDHYVYLREVLLLPVRQLLSNGIHQVLEDISRIEIFFGGERHGRKKFLQFTKQLILTPNSLQFGLIVLKYKVDIGQWVGSEQNLLELRHEEVALEE